MKRPLILPDGGTIDIQIPPEFGSPIFALNDWASPADRKKAIIFGVLGVAALGAAIWFWRKSV